MLTVNRVKSKSGNHFDEVMAGRRNVVSQFTESMAHRVAPAPASSGISFRELPESTFEEVVKICNHYEQKAAGKYSAESPAARYLFDLSREVKEQIAILQERDNKANQRLSHLELILKEWNDEFGRSNTENIEVAFGELAITPKVLREQLIAYRRRIEELEKAVDAVEEQRLSDIQRLENEIHNQHKAMKERHNMEKDRLNQEFGGGVSQLRQQCAKEVEDVRQNYVRAYEELFKFKDDEIREVSQSYEETIRNLENELQRSQLQHSDETAKIRESMRLEQELYERNLMQKLELAELSHSKEIEEIERKHTMEVTDIRRGMTKSCADDVSTRFKNLLSHLSSTSILPSGAQVSDAGVPTIPMATNTDALPDEAGKRACAERENERLAFELERVGKQLVMTENMLSTQQDINGSLRNENGHQRRRIDELVGIVTDLQQRVSRTEASNHSRDVHTKQQTLQYAALSASVAKSGAAKEVKATFGEHICENESNKQLHDKLSTLREKTNNLLGRSTTNVH